MGADGTIATGINNSGQIVGTYYDSSGTAHGFLYSGGIYTTIDGPLEVEGTIAYGINDAGQIVGSYYNSNGISLGFSATPMPNPIPPASTIVTMIMNIPSSGDYEIYDIGGNAILAAYSLGQVGPPWTFVGLGTFQAGDTSDMLLRNTSTGAFEAYYVSNNNITNAALVGTVGTNWNFAGTGDFDGASSLIRAFTAQHRQRLF